MNVSLWVNAYRSGDYVGRSLWVGPWYERNRTDNQENDADISQVGPVQSSEEMCIGLGAHTHYWDRSAPDVAKMLDRLISAESEAKDNSQATALSVARERE